MPPPAALPPGYRFTDSVDRVAAVTLLGQEFSHLAADPSPLEPLWSGATGVLADDELVAIVFLSPAGREAPGFGRGDYLMVAAAHRSRPIARALFGELSRQTRERGYRGLVAKTDRMRAIVFYERLGGRVAGYERLPSRLERAHAKLAAAASTRVVRLRRRRAR